MDNWKPKYLPQISAPFTHVVNSLNKEGVPFKQMGLSANELSPIQSLIDTDKVEQIIQSLLMGEKLDPVWVDANNKILDGHHRYVAYKKAMPENLMHVVKIMAEEKDAIRVLNKIQDIYDHNMEMNGMTEPQKLDTIDNYAGDRSDALQQSKVINPAELPPEETPVQSADGSVDKVLVLDIIKEILAQNILNTNKEVTPETIGQSPDAEVVDLEGDGEVALEEEETIDLVDGQNAIVGFRTSPIVNGSKCGNFFKLASTDDNDLRFQIDFDNLHNVIYNTPAELVNFWYPNEDIERMSNNMNIEPNKLVNRLAAKRAMEQGYDGINYNNQYVQALDDL